MLECLFTSLWIYIFSNKRLGFFPTRSFEMRPTQNVNPPPHSPINELDRTQVGFLEQDILLDGEINKSNK